MKQNYTTKVANIFECKPCDYCTSKKSNYEKHIMTTKHIFRTKCNKKILQCETCDKIYKSRSGLWSHSKNCCKKKMEETKLVTVFDNEVIMKLLQENQEFKEKLFELASKPTIVQKNIQNNKQFNLNIFLNETCKHAMNMSDFVNSLVICNEDFENMGKLGYVQGISNILIRGLKGLDQTERPCHCTDKKRETLYVKQNNVWNKEQAVDIMKQVILDVSYKNVKKIPFWKAEHPSCEDTSTQKYLEYITILNQVMTGIHPDKETDIDKIVRNVAHSVVLDKISQVL